MQHDFGAAPEQVFDGFVTAYEPKPDWVLESACDLRVGGSWDLVFRPPGLARFTEHRVFATVGRPTALGYRATIAQPGEPGFDTDVAVTIERTASGSALVLEQNGFPTADRRDRFATAWPDVLAMIAEKLAG